jgi:hypothetical protein
MTPTPTFAWNETDFIECLSIIPEVEEDGIAHHFVLYRKGLRLVLSIYTYDSEVWISLYREESQQSLFTVSLKDSSGARLVRNQNGQDYLEFAAGDVFGGRYDREPVIPMGIRLSVDPDFKIEFFQ